MRKALALAERGRGGTSPNPMVGALVVTADGVIVGRGAHRVAGGPHAEVIALEDAGARARGATLYCTLEPCSHMGRTGPCAPLVTNAGIKRAIIAIEDPNPVVQGRGLAQAREFMGVAGVNGIVLTKLDGTAKGGIAVAIAHDLKLPIRYVGVGEGIDDLIPFSAQDYVDALFQEKW